MYVYDSDNSVNSEKLNNIRYFTQLKNNLIQIQDDIYYNKNIKIVYIWSWNLNINYETRSNTVLSPLYVSNCFIYKYNTQTKQIYEVNMKEYFKGE